MLRRIFAIGLLLICLLPLSVKAEEGHCLYFGLLHAHTDISDGTGSVEEAFAYAANVENLDFFAVTDHSNSFDHAQSGSITADGSAISAQWATGKAAAAAVTREDFLGIFGYEMTWQEGKHLGHLNTFLTPGWESRNLEIYADPRTALETYYEALTQIPNSVTQFNHPGEFYGNFDNFGHCRPEYDDLIHLVEVGGEEGFTGGDAYTKALDAGWHVSPSASQNNHKGQWGDANGVRTAVLAESLTEEGIFEAIRSHRVYATADQDLEIRYRINGRGMGSRIPMADSADLTLELKDPTDTGLCTVEVITRGAAVLAREEMETNGILELSLPGGMEYYYLRITQSDGDPALTAPVWMENGDNFGISEFKTGEILPVAGRETEFLLQLYNREGLPWTISRIELYAGDNPVALLSHPGQVEPGSVASFSIPCTCLSDGPAEFTATVTGTMAGQSQIRSETLNLRFRPPETLSHILADGSHGNAGIGELTRFTELCAQENMNVEVFSGDMPPGGKILLITAPAQAFEEEFLACVTEFLREGGSLILCGSAGGSPQLNRLLKAAESGLSFNADLARDPQTNGGSPELLSASEFQTDSPWCQTLAEGQFYTHHNGCTVSGGSWLVKHGEDILLTWEETPYGGSIFAAGSLFLTDSQIPEPETVWDPPRANQSILEAILGINRTVLPLSSIESVHWGREGELFRITGYVTAGTANACNTFPGTLYLQDDTGGIAVTRFTDTGIQLGTCLEVMGRLRWHLAAPELELTDYRILPESRRNPTPRTVSNKIAMDYGVHGGELLQIQGTVTELVKTEDGRGIARLVIQDSAQDPAIVEIEETIRSGSTGANTLAKSIRLGTTVRATGLLHMNRQGETVLRVRNCEEVVAVPKVKDPTNPDTGDWFSRLWQLFFL